MLTKKRPLSPGKLRKNDLARIVLAIQERLYLAEDHRWSTAAFAFAFYKENPVKFLHDILQRNGLTPVP